jgi:hypothetical protein
MGAWYNTQTKQIEGAKPGTRSYYHEERHAWQDKLGILNVASWMYFFCIPLTIVLLVLYPQYYLLALMPAGVHYALMMAIEVDAWIYALTHEESNYSGSV